MIITITLKVKTFSTLLVHETPYVTLKIGFHMDNKRVDEIKH